MSAANGGSRTTDTILHDTLAELMEREERLEVFVEEHAKVRHAIATIEKALKPKGAKPSTRSGRTAPSGSDSPRAKAIAKIGAALKDSLDPLGQETIADLTGLKDGMWLRGLLAQMVAAGDAVEIEGKYGVPVQVNTE